ncbi:MAG: hypothetical protein AB1349_05565 [Elusimicrobiota bacterium]
MDAEIKENHKKYLDRIRLYKSFGYDVEENRKFIFEVAQPIYGEILEIISRINILPSQRKATDFSRRLLYSSC